MKYDFETLIDRRNTGAEKWNGLDIPDGSAPLSVADVDMKLCPEIKDGLIEFLNNNPVLGYTAGTDDYYKAVIKWLKDNHNFEIKKDWIVVSDGIVPALNRTVAAYTKENEGVIIFTPVYYPFFSAIKNNNRKVVECPLINKDTNYYIDFDLFEELASNSKNTLLILCSPHNPVGRVWTKEELLKIGEIALKNNLIIVSDEIHEDLTMPGIKHYPIASLSKELENITVTCTAPSKSFNIAGLQGSNIIISNEELRIKFKNKQSEIGFFSLNTLSYEATKLAYTKGEKWLEEFKELINHNYNILVEYVKTNLPKAIVYPLEGTYLAWIDFREYEYNYKELEDKMNQAKVYLDHGYIFGSVGEGFERFNIACPTNVLIDALERIKNIL